MAVFRVEKTKDFTIMSNHHLRNPNLSLKAKGLLSLMLSLPEDWDYTTKGLAQICKEGVDSIGTALKELERYGYLTRRRLRCENGQLGDIEYTIHETPAEISGESSSPKRENPEQVNPEQVNSGQENPKQATAVQEEYLAEEAEPLHKMISDYEKKYGINTYSIYQLNFSDSTDPYRFMPFSWLQEKGLTVERGNYQMVYSAELTPGDTLHTKVP